MRHAVLLILIFGFFISSCKTLDKPVTEVKAEMTPTEKMRLDATEQKHAEGELTETEYQLEKDSIAREKIVKF